MTIGKVHSRALAIALLVGGLLVAGTVSVALTMAAEDDLGRTMEHHRTDEAYAARIAAHLQARFVVADYLAQRVLDERPQTQAGFAAMTQPARDMFSGFQAINWIDENRIVQWITPVEGNEPALGLDTSKIPASVEALDRSLAENRLIMTGPIELAQGGRGVVGYQGLRDEEGNFIGSLNLVFRISDLLSGAVKDIRDDIHSLRILDGDEVVFDDGIKRPSDRVWETSIALPGREWTLQLFELQEPTSELAKPYLIVLVLGAITSLSVGVLVYAQIARQDKIAAEERRFRDFANLNSDWFWETDASLRFSFFSERFDEVTGVKSTDLLGRTRAEVGAPGADPEAYAAMLACMASHRPFFGFEHYRDHPVRGRVRISISGVPVYQEGKFVGYRGVGRDVTKEQQHAVQLEHALALAEQANQAKSEFLATMSHELRTPLNAILGFSEMMVQEVYGKIGNSNYLDYAQHISSSGRHLLELINEVLDISAIEAGKRRLDLEKIDVMNVVKDCLTYLTHDADKKKIAIIFETDGEPRDIVSDRTAIKQIVLNIVSNAVKYNKPGGEIAVTVAFRDDVFKLIVRDTGVGIPSEALQGVTEPFFRTQTNPHLTQEGTGLGLAIVKHLVEQHLGTLSIESEEGVGTVVTVVLPQKLNLGRRRDDPAPGLI